MGLHVRFFVQLQTANDDVQQYMHAKITLPLLPKCLFRIILKLHKHHDNSSLFDFIRK